MKDYAALEAAAAQNPRLNDVLVQQGENFISLRSTFGLWLKKEGRQINAPTVESLQEYPPGYDMVLDFTQAVDSKVHFKSSGRPSAAVWKTPCRAGGWNFTFPAHLISAGKGSSRWSSLPAISRRR